MQSQKERQIIFFDLAVGTNPPGRLPPMGELARYLMERVDAGLCVRSVEKDRYLIQISRARLVSMGEDREALALLFAFADPDAADPANMHLTTRAIRRFDKQEGEGRAVSAHALIALWPHQYGGNRFQVLLEGADRLGKTRVLAHLQAQFRAIFKDKEITVETVDGEDAPAKPALDLDAIASERLRSGMKAGGVLHEVRLIDTKVTERGFDAPDPVKVRRREMRLKVDVPSGRTIQNVLEEIKPWARRQHFEEVYVRWSNPPDESESAGREGPARGQHIERAKINLAQEDIGATLYAKKEFITLEHPLSDLSEHLSDELVGAMAKLLS